MFQLFFILIGLLLSRLCSVEAVYFSEQEKRYHYPEFKFRANQAHDEQRAAVVENTLKEAAGVYRNKTYGHSMGLDKTVFVSVVAFNEDAIAHYKLYFHNLLCYTQHYNIDIIVYMLHHNLANFDLEKKQLTDMGIKVLPYPDELFWTLLATKRTVVYSGTGKAHYQAKIPQFSSHGALVMLVPVLEVLLTGYNAIFFDVDIALVVDPVPYLTRGDADFVTTVEMRHCPDHYTPTVQAAIRKEGSSDAHSKHGGAGTGTDVSTSGAPSAPVATPGVINPLLGESVNWNWHTVEPNTGTMYVRSTESGVGFYASWLLRIIDSNEMNDQKAFLRDDSVTVSSRNCVYGKIHRPTMDAVSGKITNPTGGRHAHKTHKNVNEVNPKWGKNYATLLADMESHNYNRPASFCFVSELLFQNGQTAFACGVKPGYRDSWLLNMDAHGLRSIQPELQTNNNNNNHNHNHHSTLHSKPHAEQHAKATPHLADTQQQQQQQLQKNVPRFPVTVHANFCDKKTHELEVRGLWLLKEDSPEFTFNASTCRAYDPYKTYYATLNWTQEVGAVKNKRAYMMKEFVKPGALIQSTTAKEVYLVDSNKFRTLIPDGDTFIAKMGDNKWKDVKFLPQPIIDLVPLGEPIVSVRNAPKPKAKIADDVKHSTSASTSITSGTSISPPISATGTIS